MSHEVFSEQQVTEIIRRAVAIQEQGSQQGKDYTPGITREELERIAKEVGVSVDALRQAIEESKSPTKRKLFAPMEEFERVIDGELDPNDFDVVASLLRGNTTSRAPITQVGRSIGGQTWVAPTLTHVDVTSRSGRTRVKVKPTIFGPFMLGAYPGIMGAILTGALLGEKGFVAAAIASATAFVISGITAFLVLQKKSAHSAENFAEKLRDRIAEHLESSSQVNTQQTISEPEQIHQRIGDHPSS
ncbi:MAG TPA: hypothetical protein PKA27_04040 [Fimbriimonadaceae bacterium]|nr:hypothetical protein [Fimbriimonadaceae bacterium]